MGPPTSGSHGPLPIQASALPAATTTMTPDHTSMPAPCSVLALKATTFTEIMHVIGKEKFLDTVQCEGLIFNTSYISCNRSCDLVYKSTVIATMVK